MAFALVGTIGVASQGAASAAVTPAWGTSENRTAGNLLVCFVSVGATATLPATPSGWSIASQISGSGGSSTIFTKIAAGTDAAPTIAALTGGVIAAQLAEFSGNRQDAGYLDRVGSATGTTSPVTATASAAQDATGELILLASADRRSVARASVDTLTSNQGSVVQAGNNNGVSSQNHYSFGYILSGSSTTAATSVVTLSITTSISSVQSLVAAIEAPATAKSGSDTGVGGDAAVEIETPRTDAGVGSDAVLRIGLQGDEAGVAVESASVSTPPVGVSGSESGVGSEVAAVTVPVGSSESGVGADLASLAAGLSASESSVGSDVASSVGAVLAASDSGAGTDLSGSVRISGPSDGGVGSDTAAVTVPIAGTGESAVGSDLASLVTASAAAETGLGGDASSVKAVLSSVESGAGTDSASAPVVQVSAVESGSGLEIASLSAPGAVSANDAGSGSDLATSVGAVLGATDAGIGSDIASVSTQTPKAATDAGIGSEVASVSVQVQGSGESGILAEVAGLLAILAASEEGIVLETAQARAGDYRSRLEEGGISDADTMGSSVSDRARSRVEVGVGTTAGATLSDRGVLVGASTDGPPVAVRVEDG